MSLEFAIYQLLMELGAIQDLAAWYAIGDELI